MFGLEDKKNEEETQYELEKEFLDKEKSIKIRDKVTSRIEEVKKELQEGDSKEEIEKLSKILLGLAAVLKTMIRCISPQGK